MIDGLITYIQTIIAEYGAWGVFVATLLEEIVAPIPSPIVPLAGGFFAIAPDLSWLEAVTKALLVVALPVSVGVGIGSTIVYAVGYYGGKPIIERYKRWLGLSWQDIEKAEQRLTRGRGDEVALFALRILPIIPGVGISGFCGLVRYPFGSFIIITLVGAFIRAMVLALIGWRVGDLYAEYSHKVEQIEDYLLYGTLVVVAIGLVYFWLKRRSRKS